MMKTNKVIQGALILLIGCMLPLLWTRIDVIINDKRYTNGIIISGVLTTFMSLVIGIIKLVNPINY